MKPSSKVGTLARRLSFGTSWPLVLAAATVIGLGMAAVHALGESGILVEQRSRHTQALLDIERLLSTLKDAETGQRGYIITGRAAYLEPYEEAGRRLTHALGALETTLAGETELLAGIARLRPLIKTHLEELSRTIALRREGRTEEVMSLVGSDHGRFTMARIRDEAGAFSARLIALRDASNRDYFSSVRWSFLVVIGGSAFLFVLTAFATMTTARELRARSRAERSARQRGERYRSLVDASSQVVWNADRNGAMVDTEGAFAALAGRSRDEVVGSGWLDALHPEDRGATEAAFRAAIEKPAAFSAEHRVRRHDGQWRIFAVRVVPVSDDDGRTREWVGVHTDVTERRRGEQRLRFLAEVSALLASTSDLKRALAEVATLSVPTFADWCAIDAVLPGATSGTPARLAVACADPRREGLAEILRQNPPRYDDETGGIAEVFRTGRSCLVVSPDSHHWAAVIGNMAGDPDRRSALANLSLRAFIMAPLRARGRVVGVLTWGVAESGKTFGPEDLAFGEEIAARTGAAIDASRLLAETEEARRLLDVIFEAAPVGLALFDRDLRFSRINAALARISGIPADDHVGETLPKLLPEMDPALAESLKQARDRGEAIECEVRGRTPAQKDERIWIARCSPTEAGVIALLMDITERKRVEAEREHLVRALARSNQDLNEFAYVASHDLKAPLRGITHLSEWLEEDLGPHMPEPAREKLGLLRGRAKRLEGLIDGILNYARAGRARSAAAVVDVRAMLKEVVDLLGKAAGEAVTIAPPPRGERWPVLLTEKAALEQVFMNLISNALKHGRVDQPCVVVSAEVNETDRCWTFSVADNGPGIAPEYHERIWGIFQTLQARDKVEGAGIGLAIVKKIVENAGGRVSVDSALGAGAKFSFSWPAPERSEPARPPDGPRAEAVLS